MINAYNVDQTKICVVLDTNGTRTKLCVYVSNNTINEILLITLNALNTCIIKS